MLLWKRKTAYEVRGGVVGSEVCIGDRGKGLGSGV